MKKISKYVFLDIIRNRIVIAYTLLLLLISFSVFSLEDNPQKGVLSLVNLVMIIVPLVSIIFSTIYVYNSSEFIELLVAQPLKRKSIWLSMFAGLSVTLALSFLVGVGLPAMLMNPGTDSMVLTFAGMALTVIFVSIAMLSSVLTRDKAKGIGVGIMLWFFFTMIYDGIVLFILFQFGDYPLEKPTIALSMLNPVDLARIMMLLQLDISAMMGYTGALFNQVFGGKTGMVLATFVLAVWAIVPYWFSARKFASKDL